MNSPNSVSGTSPSVAPPTRSIVVLLADGSRLRVTCRDLAAQLRQERSAALKRLRQSRADAKADVADRIGEARIRREFEASEREMDAAIRRLSKQVRVKPEPSRSSSSARHSRSTAARAGHAGVIVTRSTSSALARRDRLGREGIMLRIRYVRAGGKHASPGCLRRHWRYIAREAAVTLDSEGREIVLSNFGETIDDIADALGLQEQVLREMRRNAKLGFRMIGAFPYGLPVDARREVLQRLGDELFGARDLPWSAAAHDADPDAKVDNPHFHLDYGLLPMARQADGSFIVSNDLRTDLDGQEGLRFIRHTVARVMTEVAQEYGLDRSFTALSYRERGMDRDGGEHVGQEGTAAHRRGDYVATIARNEAKQRRAKAREKARRARERLDGLERLKQAITAVPASPSMANEPLPSEATAVVAPEAAPAMTQPLEVSELPAAPEPAAVPVIDTAPVAGAPQSVDGPSSAVLGSAALDLIPAPATSDSVPVAIILPGAAPSAGVPESRMTVTSAPTNDAVPPTVSAFVFAPDRASTPKVPSRFGRKAPATKSVPLVGATGHPAPHVAAVLLPRTDMPIAPTVDVVPPMVEIGRTIASIAPPGVTLFGPSIDPLSVAVPPIWAIGRKAAIDSDDALTEQRLAEVIADEEERRRTDEPDQAAEGDRLRVDTAAFEALCRHDEWLGEDDQGRYTVSDAALRVSGLSRVDIETPAAQAALEAIGFAQVDRLDPVLDDRSGRPVLHVDGGVIRLDDRFPAGLRDDVARWSENPHFRAFIVKVWPALGEALTPVSDTPVVALIPSDEQRRRALEGMLAAIAGERHFLRQEYGMVVVGPRLLARFDLLPADVAGEAARARLAELVGQQAAEVSQIATHVRASPHHIVPDGDGWRLGDAAPAHVRLLVAAWRNDATMQQALGRAAAARPAAESPRDVAEPVAEPVGAAWCSARVAREQAMADGDALERRDGNGLMQPGCRIARPGVETIGDPPPVARRFPGLPGRGMGD